MQSMCQRNDFDDDFSGTAAQRRAAGSSIWMTALGAGFAGWALATEGTTAGAALMGTISVAAVALIVFSIRMLRGVLGLPYRKGGDPAQARRILRDFWMVVAAECSAFVVVGAVCGRGHLWKFLVPLDIMIVGLHYFPLARIFRVPRLNVAGGLFCLIPMATMLLVPSSAHVGHAGAWLVLPSVGCGLVAFGIALAGLNEVRRLVNGDRGKIGADILMT
jgi:hypothetical protein